LAGRVAFGGGDRHLADKAAVDEHGGGASRGTARWRDSQAVPFCRWALG
jgi:hypothetical protein